MSFICATKYRFDLCNPDEAYLWDDLCERKAADGIHHTILPPNIPRLDKQAYELIPMGHYRLDVKGGRILYDFVTYHDKTQCKAEGYTLTLWEPTGRMVEASPGFDRSFEQRAIPPLPAPPPGWIPEETPEPSATTRALDALREREVGSYAEAARMFGITPQCVSAAAMAVGLIMPERGPSLTLQAVEALRTGQVATQAEAARLFGITPAAVCVAAKAAGVTSTGRAPGRTAQAVEWLRAHPGRTQADAAREFGACQSNISAYLARNNRTY